MDIHSAIQFGTKNNVKVVPSSQNAPINPAYDTSHRQQVVNSPSVHAPNGQTMNTHTTNTPQHPKTNTAPASLKPELTQTTHEVPIAPAPVVFRPVDLHIAGTTHCINCPVDEIAQLERAGEFINDKIREIRHETKGKNLSNEELLVLICLELYDNQENLRIERRNQLSDNERARALIEKINKDARSVL